MSWKIERSGNLKSSCQRTILHYNQTWISRSLGTPILRRHFFICPIAVWLNKPWPLFDFSDCLKLILSDGEVSVARSGCPPLRLAQSACLVYGNSCAPGLDVKRPSPSASKNGCSGMKDPLAMLSWTLIQLTGTNVRFFYCLDMCGWPQEYLLIFTKNIPLSFTFSSFFWGLSLSRPANSSLMLPPPPGSELKP